MRPIKRGGADPEVSARAIVLDRVAKVFEVFAEHGVDARLVGSLGWASAIDAEPSSFVSAVNGTGVKDIDVLVIGGEPERIAQAFREASAVARPCRLDHVFPGLVRVDATGAYLRYRKILLPIDARTIERATGHIGDLSVPTLNPRSLAHFVGFFFVGLNRKTINNLHRYLKAIAHRNDLLAEELFVPYHRMFDLAGQQYPVHVMLGVLRRRYHERIPRNIRRVAMPITKPMRHLLVH